MLRTATMTLFQLLVACLALAVDETPVGSGRSTTRSPDFEVTVRSLTDSVRVLSDTAGGWRMERYFSGFDFLVSAEDTYGPLVDVTRDVNGRTTGVLLANRYALEYFYPGPGAPWSSKILYVPRTGEVLAHVANPELSDHASGGARTWSRELRFGSVEAANRLYAVEPADADAPVIRSLELDDPVSGSMLDRFDYTESHLIVHLGGAGENLPRIVAIPRHIQDASEPHIVELGEPEAARYEVVWSLAGGATGTPEPMPHLKGALTPEVEDKLREAFPLALDRVRRLPTCRALFEGFLTSGNRRLSDTLYASPGESTIEESCGTGAAYTHVRSPITRLCPVFGGLDRNQAAVVLIHEALHFAGLGEAPFYSNAPTSEQINLMVQNACGF